MKDIFNFINNNAVVASLFTLGITTIIQVIFRKNDRKYNEKQENKKERKQQFLNKAELHIEDKKWDSKENPDICLFMTNFTLTKLMSFIFQEKKGYLCATCVLLNRLYKYFILLNRHKKRGKDINILTNFN